MYALLAASCSATSEDDSNAQRFVEARAMESSWCETAQRIVGGFDDRSLPDERMTETLHPAPADFHSSKATVGGTPSTVALQAQAIVFTASSAPALPT
jgi:hypothetical protein